MLINKRLTDFGFVKTSQGVYQCGTSPAAITDEILSSLEQECQRSPLKRCRINYHLDAANLVHEMILCLLLETKIQPHSHLNKDESFHIIRGKIAIGFLEPEKPLVSDLYFLNADQGPYFMRIRAGIQHLVVPLSDICIVHETTQGPFIQNEAHVPGWAKEEGGADRVRKLRSTLVRQGLNS